MPGLSMVLNIAKNAFFAAQHGLEVTSHNIANVNTPGFSRQTPVYEAQTPSVNDGFMMGRGVTLENIARDTNVYVEAQLAGEKSSLASAEEMKQHMQILEGLFSEDSTASLSKMLAEFWNHWQDLSDNPAGASERIALYEQSRLIAGQFKDLHAGLRNLNTDLTRSLELGLTDVNTLTKEIARLNREIVSTEAISSANDSRDARTRLVAELSEYMNVQSFEQPSGVLTVVGPKGCVMVQGDRSYTLEMGGDDGDRVLLRGAGKTVTDITDYVDNGRLGGQLEMRDRHLAKFRMDLDAVVGELVWAVNSVHSQGVGLDLFQPGEVLTGAYSTDGQLGDLPFGERITFSENALTLWIEDRSDPQNPTHAEFSFDLSGFNTDTQLSDLADGMNNQMAAAGVGGVTFDGSGSRITVTADAAHAFGFSDDSSNLLAALGINVFFEGRGAASIDVSERLAAHKEEIAAARITAGGVYAQGDNVNALAVADLQFTAVNVAQWTFDRQSGASRSTAHISIEEAYHSLLGNIGIASGSIERSCEFSENLVNQLSTIRDGISGVSLDEEMTRIIQFEHAFAAAGKLISSADEMMQTLLSLK